MDERVSRIRAIGAAVAVIGWLVLLAPACGSDGGSSGDDIYDRLAALPGVMVIERPAPDSPGYRYFILTLEQPVEEGSDQTFRQYLSLLYLGDDQPVALTTTGYHDYQEDYLSEPAALLHANQLTIEHRFFATSRPDPADWSKLDIERSAGDFHRVVELFRPVLGDGPWVGSGASKGGMTSLYHRRFFPDDVDATIAYVAPLSYGTADDRYAPFFDTVGTPACRQQVSDVQRLTLQRRAAMVDLAQQFGFGPFELLGEARSVELAIAEEEWSFWQYLGAAYCGSFVPDPATASDFDLFFFLWQANSIDNYADPKLDLFQPYYYQSATQLGYPALPDANISDLLEYDPDDLTPLLPAGVDVAFDAAAMEDIAAWIGSDAERVMLIYGEWDPWYAGAMDLGTSADSYRFVAPQANHGASIRDLDATDHDQALAAIEAWTGVTPDSAAAAALPPRDLAGPDTLRRH